MQIRLTVLGPRREPSAGRPAASDVLVTSPTGTALAAIAADLAAAVGVDRSDGPVVLYAGHERLDARRATLGEPPLLDGAMLSVGAPADPGPDPAVGAAAQLHVIAGPDAGGVHLLHGGQIRVGRSAHADVPLDDPDVSRLHCAVTVAPGGEVTVTDLGSTNGTTIAGIPVTTHPVRLPPGAPLRLGESTLRLTSTPATAEATGTLPTVPDGEGQVRVRVRGDGSGGDDGAGRAGGTGGPEAVRGASHPVPGARTAPDGSTHHGYGSAGWGAAGGAAEPGGAAATAARGHETGGRRPGPGAGPAPESVAREVYERTADSREGTYPQRPGAADTPWPADRDGSGHASRPDAPYADRGDTPYADQGHGHTDQGHGGTHVQDNPLHGAPGPRGARRRSGLSAWARRITGGRPDDAQGEYGEGPVGHDLDATSVRHAYGWYGGHGAAMGRDGVPYPADPGDEEALAEAAAVWPDPASLLLTALGPGTRLWERGTGHPEALTIRLGTVDRPAQGGTGRLPALPVTVRLRDVGALGLAGPRERLSGLARSVVAQLAALHSPEILEIVLISTDRSRTTEVRTAEWAWLGWLPHLRPAHGQDCRLLLAFDRDQAAARTSELVRRLEGRLRDENRLWDADDGREAGAPGIAVPGQGRAPAAGGTPDARPAQGTPYDRTDHDGARHRPDDARSTPFRAKDEPPGASPHPCADDTFTVVVVDGDPGSAELRAAVDWLAVQGAAAGMHVLCLAETPAPTPPAPPAPLESTYEAACGASPVFRSCRAVAVLSGDVATALRLLRTVDGRITGQAASARGAGAGQVPPAAVDAVSAAWAERFARALAPLRPEGATGGQRTPGSAPLPATARLLDELGLARATPASLLARWAAAADDGQPSPQGHRKYAMAPGGRASAVFGAGTRGPVGADLVAEGPHLLVEGPAGSGRTELLCAIAASLAAAERPERLGLVLIDGRDTTCGIGGGAAGAHSGERAGGGGGGAAGRSGTGDGLRICLDLPHATAHLAVQDPVRMREFAQSLTAELKRRAEVLGALDFAAWHAARAGRGAPGHRGGRTAETAAVEAQTGVTLRLRPEAVVRQRPEPAPGSRAGSAPAGSVPARAAAPDAGLPGTASQEDPPMPRLVVLVDDVDALLAPPLGSPGRPAAGSVVRALEAVARDGARLGVHLVATAGTPGGRVQDTELARHATLRVVLEAPSGGGAEEPAPGRGRVRRPDGTTTAFQAGRVTGRIPRTGTLRPTVMPLEWDRMGDPPARRSVRELGNGPTDLALLASALERAARAAGSGGT
ncbi:FHA domain-containing protein [Streptomyces odontomachi]|uniref:FHA domain-containing protein n=1 Tax=Streptomyces odontomachi TaxID=2944940 RepID=UPI00210E2815|nr:FHA domain-containing protein [Streptomyces sp. ODS25]